MSFYFVACIELQKHEILSYWRYTLQVNAEFWMTLNFRSTAGLRRLFTLKFTIKILQLIVSNFAKWWIPETTRHGKCFVDFLHASHALIAPVQKWITFCRFRFSSDLQSLPLPFRKGHWPYHVTAPRSEQIVSSSQELHERSISAVSMIFSLQHCFTMWKNCTFHFRLRKHQMKSTTLKLVDLILLS